MGGHRRRISLPGVRTHKLINLVLMEDLDTQSAHLRPLRPPHLSLLAAAAIFHLNDAETDATGISEGLSGPHRFLLFFFSPFFPFSFIDRQTHFEVIGTLPANSSQRERLHLRCSVCLRGLSTQSGSSFCPPCQTSSRGSNFILFLTRFTLLPHNWRQEVSDDPTPPSVVVVVVLCCF